MIFKQANQDNFEEPEIPDISTIPSSNELPSSIIVTNLMPEIFDDAHERELFESHFEDIDDNATFHYIRSFSRVRINFTSSQQAAEARFRMHHKDYRGHIMKCYFIRPIMIGNTSHLEPPKREKQFLISPPASPPVGWEPVEEAQPLINYDLLGALAGLAPGESHELHPQSRDHPAIVVHVCEEDESNERNPSGSCLPQTRCPERKEPLDS